ncbi:hypothetical protein ACSXAY_18610 (plasmid) [Clostridium perfringens]
MKLSVDELHRLSILIGKINASKSNNISQNLPDIFIISFNNSLWACEGLKVHNVIITGFELPSITLYKLGENLEERIVITPTEVPLYNAFQKINEEKIFNSNHYKFLSKNELPYFLSDFYEIIKDGSTFEESLKVKLPTCLFNAKNLTTGIPCPYLALDKNNKYELISIVSSEDLKKLKP